MRTDKGSVRSHIVLFDGGMGQFIGDPQFLGGFRNVAVVLFQTRFHGEVAVAQIHTIVQGIDRELHRIDAHDAAHIDFFF